MRDWGKIDRDARLMETLVRDGEIADPYWGPSIRLSLQISSPITPLSQASFLSTTSVHINMLSGPSH